jgi:hydrogenase small subunit
LACRFRGKHAHEGGKVNGGAGRGQRPAGDHDAAALPAEFVAALTSRGLSRRRFLGYCAGLTAVLALPPRMTGEVARGLAAAAVSGRPRVVWLEFQDCAGCVESFLRSGDPDVASLLFGMISLDYQETLMAAAGGQAEAAKRAAMARPGYLLIVEGSVPQGSIAGACTIGGRSAADLLAEAAKNAGAIIAVGTCASFGGIPAASPNPTGAVGAHELVSGVPLVNVSGCPPNGDNIGAAIAHFLSFGGLPAADELGRPLFAYGDRIHDHCDRRAFFDAGQFALDFGDEGHSEGWCLYKLGCKGPSTFHNCPTLRWNDHTSWPVAAGHGCVGCSQPGFWDTMTPFYSQLPNVSGFGAEATANEIGEIVVIGTAALFAAHGVGKAVQHRLARRGAAEAGSRDVAEASGETGSAGAGANPPGAGSDGAEGAPQ